MSSIAANHRETRFAWTMREEMGRKVEMVVSELQRRSVASREATPMRKRKRTTLSCSFSCHNNLDYAAVKSRGHIVWMANMLQRNRKRDSIRFSDFEKALL